MASTLAYRLITGRNDPLLFGLRLLLLPAYLLVLLAVTVRNALYDAGLLPVVSVGVPVISVGNLTVGGTGKTPLVIALAERALAKGKRVAIVARRYGARVDAQGRSDEVALLAARLPRAEIVMTRDKLTGARQAAARGVDVILVDDGLQHRRLHRDLEIVVVNARVPVSNGYVLPLGGLREPPSALARADAIVLTHADGLDEERLESVRIGLAAWRRDVPVVRAEHVPLGVRPVAGGPLLPKESLRGRSLHLFCGIGEPAGFRRTVEALGASVVGLTAFPDHRDFGPADLAAVRAVAGPAALLCTEKDAHKVAAIPGTGDISCLVVELRLAGALPPLPGVDA